MDDRDLSDSTNGRLERAKDQALGKHDSHPSVADQVGEGVGGIGGMLAGAAIGTAAGPVGTLIGGIAGAVGGWWTGRAVTEAASAMTTADDNHYRSHFEATNRLADRSYEEMRPAYHLGHIAANNPDYSGRDWNDVERDLQRGWNADATHRYGDWSTVRGYANEGFIRGRSNLDNAAARTDDTMHDAGRAMRNAGDRAMAGAERAGNKAANAVDDMKDRMDGNPASRPGPDATDSNRRLNNQ